MNNSIKKKADQSLKFVYSDNETLSVIFQNNDLLMGVVGEFNCNLKELENIHNEKYEYFSSEMGDNQEFPDWIQKALTQSIMVVLLGIVTFGVLRPLVNRIIVPIDAGRPGEPLSGTDDDEVDLDKVTVQEGETLEDIKAKLKPKKQTISAEMLDTANTYDDKVAVIRMIVSDEAGRVSNVFKTMMKKDIEV